MEPKDRVRRHAGLWKAQKHRARRKTDATPDLNPLARRPELPDLGQPCAQCTAAVIADDVRLLHEGDRCLRTCAMRSHKTRNTHGNCGQTTTPPTVPRTASHSLHVPTPSDPASPSDLPVRPHRAHHPLAQVKVSLPASGGDQAILGKCY